MSDQPRGTDWWLATDGKWYPPTFKNAGLMYYVDPTDRHGYRAAVDGCWTEHVLKSPMSLLGNRDPDGATLLANVPVPVRARELDQGAASASAAVGSGQSADGVGVTLEFIGWLALVLSIVGGLVVARNGEPALGIAILIGGCIQSLVLVGFARVIRYTRETALLLRMAVDDR